MHGPISRVLVKRPTRVVFVKLCKLGVDPGSTAGLLEPCVVSVPLFRIHGVCIIVSPGGEEEI
jgi:hypothetical protein